MSGSRASPEVPARISPNNTLSTNAVMLEDDPVQSALKRAIATTIDQPRPVAKRPGRALD
eukprot:CAMPEP_0203889522 /NCGR_PEP_ID=MMETSP0359-20131031/33072_1 /ASSEMBLY_ACC=CAM_ASM_000338 /TAXON_ID=268821 /ORGANISM="Scrippsiella Hangoei, Strain SHTV-5" /LENGTH=59 /DNA_ID=CAMNT_0050810959 /DNA_START=130 /DNA_END=307 /DNA_ORIENTATION=-